MPQKKRAILYGAIHILFPLALGLILYLVLRPQAYVSLLLDRLLNPRGRDFGFSRIRSSGSALVKLVNNFFPDFLWAYSFENALLLFGRPTASQKSVFLIIGLLLCLFMEGIQILLPFLTFDVLDIIVECCGVLCAWFVFWKCFKNGFGEDDR